MPKNTSASVTVKGTTIGILNVQSESYISLTDIARHKDPARSDYIIHNWLRNRNTIEFLGVWENINNPGFKSIEFDGFRRRAGLNSFVLPPRQWIDATGAIGIVSKKGRYGGTYAHKDIAFEFASWISVEFKLYLIKEFQRLKEAEAARLETGWDVQRTLAKVNYRIHTDAIKEVLLPPRLAHAQIEAVYASEADLLNVAMFGRTAAQWRQKNPALQGNMRDYATVEQLVVLSNLESVNSVLIRQGLVQSQRLRQLNSTAIAQMHSLLGLPAVRRLGTKEPEAKYTAEQDSLEILGTVSPKLRFVLTEGSNSTPYPVFNYGEFAIFRMVRREHENSNLSA
ncbi:MAG: KilA-N domain-containing protein [Elusimicrobiales bacterium]